MCQMLIAHMQDAPSVRLGGIISVILSLELTRVLSFFASLCF